MSVESLYGWQVFDQHLGRASDVLREAIGDPLPGSTLLAVNGVAGDRFVAFVPEGPDGEEARTGSAESSRRRALRSAGGGFRGRGVRRA